MKNIVVFVLVVVAFLVGKYTAPKGQLETLIASQEHGADWWAKAGHPDQWSEAQKANGFSVWVTSHGDSVLATGGEYVEKLWANQYNVDQFALAVDKAAKDWHIKDWKDCAK